MVSLDADGITTDINQTTGVVAFTVGDGAQLGDYVATITCGEAEPVEITITVTAPTTSEITVLKSGEEITAFNINRLNAKFTLNIARTPNNSTSEISYTIPQSECFTIVLTQNNGEGVGTFEITQHTLTSPRDFLDLVFTCGNATKTITVTPR